MRADTKLPPNATPKIWLCLSGGGLRAALFHFGALKRLYELDLLSCVSGISACSGGAIVAALLGLHGRNGLQKSDPEFQKDWKQFETKLLYLARHGMMGPIYLLVVSYVFYIAGGTALAFGDHWPYSLVPLGVGLLCHLSLGFVLLRQRVLVVDRNLDDLQRAHRLGVDWATSGFYPSPWLKKLKHILRSLTVPSYLRWQIMDVRLFGGAIMGQLVSFPKIFINAIDLRRGREVVFTRQRGVQLDLPGARVLWRECEDDNLDFNYDVRNVPLAQVVAASTAILPWFSPQRIGSTGAYCTDAGIIDNLALNIPLAMASYLSPMRRDSGKAFSDSITNLLIIDGSSLRESWKSPTANRIRGTLRLLDIVSAQQNDTFQAIVRVLGDGIHVNDVVGMSLMQGFPDGTFGKFQEEITKHVPGARTHLGAFSAEECAAIGYAGYQLMDTFVCTKLSIKHEAQKWVCPPPVSFSNFLVHELGQYEVDPQKLAMHLKFSAEGNALTRLLLRVLEKTDWIRVLLFIVLVSISLFFSKDVFKFWFADSYWAMLAWYMVGIVDFAIIGIWLGNTLRKRHEEILKVAVGASLASVTNVVFNGQSIQAWTASIGHIFIMAVIGWAFSYVFVGSARSHPE